MLAARARVAPCRRFALPSARLRKLSTTALPAADGHVVGFESGKLSTAGSAIDAQLGGKLSSHLKYERRPMLSRLSLILGSTSYQSSVIRFTFSAYTRNSLG